jgi:hypothetical protein
MKKILLLLLLISATVINAQEQEIKNDIQKLITAIGVPQRIEAMREYQRMWVTPDKEEEHMAKFEATIPVFLQNVEAYYLKKYTHEEIKEALKFYESPLGKKITANAAALNIAYSNADDMWSDMFYEIIFKYKD